MAVRPRTGLQAVSRDAPRRGPRSAARRGESAEAPLHSHRALRATRVPTLRQGSTTRRPRRRLPKTRDSMRTRGPWGRTPSARRAPHDPTNAPGCARAGKGNAVTGWARGRRMAVVPGAMALRTGRREQEVCHEGRASHLTPALSLPQHGMERRADGCLAYPTGALYAHTYSR